MSNDKTIHVGFVMFYPRFGAFVWMLGENCLRTEASKRGWQFTTVPVYTVEEQAAAIAQLVDSHADAIVIKPMARDNRAISEALLKAQAANIPVVSLDSPLADDALLCTVGSDSAKGQEITAEHVLAHLGHRGRVAYFQGDERVPSGIARTESFHRTVKKYPKVVVAYESMLNWLGPISRRIQGGHFMREALIREPNLDAVISATDEGALGAIDVLAELGLSRKIIVGGFDGIPEALLAVKNGQMLATVRQLPSVIAVRILDCIEAAFRGEKIPKLVYVDIDLITADKVDSSALDSLMLIPGLIHHLASNHEEQRQLQQAVITTQHNILQTVAAVSSAVSSIREPEAMMQQVVDLLGERFDLYRATLYTVASQSADVSALALRATHGAAMTVGLKPEPQACSLVDECVRSGETRSAACGTSGTDMLFELALPLKSAERIIGCIDLLSTNARAFDADTLSILEAIAHQVTIAIDNATLYQETILSAKHQHESQERLLIAEKMASLGRLTAGIAHEMNTPLAAVRSAVLETETLVKEYRDAIGDTTVNDDDHREIADEMSKALHLASSAAERAASFVKGVKSQTRDLNAQQLVNFNAVTVIKEAILLLSHALRQGKCSTHFQSDSELMEIMGSPSRLAQVVTNLITNAIDATADGGGGQIDISLKREETYVVLKVSDKGCGIPPDVLPKIFDPMFTTKPFGMGTGLGMTIVHDVVTGDFNGTVEIDSKVGKGTTFTIRLACMPPAAKH
ncbi:MAG TPA: substrate-binding domain-containing protein [Rhodocyclaceae bacterium]|nr:substrate-binding domain-containing protein [Rhodocyclaceae bacterium]